MIETQLAQLVTDIPAYESGKIPSQPENVNAVITRGGKSTRDPPYPNHVGEAIVVQEEEPVAQKDSNILEKETTPQDFEPGFLPFNLEHGR